MEEVIVIAPKLAICSGAGRARGGKNHVNAMRSRSVSRLNSDTGGKLWSVTYILISMCFLINLLAQSSFPRSLHQQSGLNELWSSGNPI